MSLPVSVRSSVAGGKGSQGLGSLCLDTELVNSFHVVEVSVRIVSSMSSFVILCVRPAGYDGRGPFGAGRGPQKPGPFLHDSGVSRCAGESSVGVRRTPTRRSSFTSDHPMSCVPGHS